MTYTYNSVPECIAALKTTAKGLSEYVLNDILEGGSDWAESFPNVAAGCKMLQNGNKELTAKYENQAANYTFAALPQIGQYQFSDEPVTGMFDVATYCANTGNDYWLNEVEATRQNKSLKITVNIAAQASVSLTAYFDRLIKIIAYIDQMEAMGIRCEVWAICICTNKIDLRIKVKEQQESVNIGQMVYQMATPVLLRFAYFIMSAKTNGSSYGDTRSDVNREQAEKAKAIKEGQVYIPSFYVPFENSYGQTINEMYPSYFNHLSI
jgi:hypothetical protein